ncbi:MAG TPA: DUF6159 family protein [Solirubrobacteraceae bacterium]|jgi:hypothetical protein
MSTDEVWSDPKYGRWARSRAALSRSWELVRSTPGLLRLGAVTLVAWLAVFATTWGIPFWLLGGPDKRLAVAVASVTAAWPLRFMGAFLGVAVVGTARRRLAGEPARARDGLRDAMARLRPILAWSLLSAGVGAVLDWIARRVPGGGALAAGLVGVAWSLLTLFVVPALVLEPVGVRDAIRRSADAFRRTWGESVTGTLSIGACLVPIGLPAGFLIGLGFGLDGAAAAALLAAGVLLFGLMITAATLMGQLFAFSLYRYATTDGREAPIFGEDLLRSGFRIRRKRRGR